LFHSPTAIMTYAQELNPDCQVTHFQNCSRSEKLLHNKKNTTLYLLYEYVPVMEKTFGSGARESCVAQQSIYVILSGNEETRSYVNQVRIVLRLLLFCLYCSVWNNTSYAIWSIFLFLKMKPSLKNRNSYTIKTLPCIYYMNMFLLWRRHSEVALERAASLSGQYT
jgi:hypothetical protein